MKFALNGALTIGTLDGANIEIRDQVGDENIFIFGAAAEEAGRLQREGSNPRQAIDASPRLKHVLDLIARGAFSPGDPSRFAPIVDQLTSRDPFLVCHDFASYVECHERVEKAWREPERWTAMSIRNTAGVGHFSSDRTVSEYARDIWAVEPTPVDLP
jgi:starch phosphorylase